MTTKKLFQKVLKFSQELRGEELEDFLWEHSCEHYGFDNYTLYDMEEGIRVLYDEKKGIIKEVRCGKGGNEK